MISTRETAKQIMEVVATQFGMFCGSRRKLAAIPCVKRTQTATAIAKGARGWPQLDHTAPAATRRIKHPMLRRLSRCQLNRGLVQAYPILRFLATSGNITVVLKEALCWGFLSTGYSDRYALQTYICFGRGSTRRCIHDFVCGGGERRKCSFARDGDSRAPYIRRPLHGIV